MIQPARKLRQSLPIHVDDLRVGMFVAELDRPWTQTPFMLQGFLLSEDLDLQTLQSLVKDLVIDPLRSDPRSLLHLPWESLHEAPAPKQPSNDTAKVTNTAKVNVLRAAKPSVLHDSFFTRGLAWCRAAADLPGHIFSAKKSAKQSAPGSKKTRQGMASAQPYYLRYAGAMNAEESPQSTTADRYSRLSPPSTKEFSGVIQSLYPRDAVFAALNWKERWQNWREQRKQQKTYVRGKNIHKPPLMHRGPDYLPKDINLVVYEDQTTIREEIGYARIVIAKTDYLLKKLADEIKNDRSIGLEEVRPTVQLLSESVISNPAALMWLLRMRTENSGTYARGLKVAVYMMTLGRHLGFSQQQLSELGFIGLLLDIGKLDLPQTLWDKEDKLSAQEQSLMQTHVHAGIRLLESGQPLSHNVLLGINEHHERLDGSGYPQGLSGGAISLFGRISAIADSFSAMTSERPYDVTRSSFDAMKELFKMAETELHAPLVEEFVQAIGIFPIGSMIELSSGEVAIVLEHNKIRRLEPKVLLLTAADKRIVDKPVMIDLMRQKKIDQNEPIKILRGLPDGAYGLACRDYYLA
ncbi:MAG: HD-GYP domain-containing protein [Undibacterium sp.]|uniref:HD-GYP domain-containing protein n=1 Tax=Undibacterium sp. TaxID=1914977 RepID=UPI002722F2E0|nr:HD-GYP domain-containing protein [Undibacterium sp.]MDO8654563.1 HD-GYP domain-containing protein [Undibacterium sp.]